jgi:hypothetical protein
MEGQRTEDRVQRRKLKSRYGARNRFQEPSLELSSQATWAGGPVRQTCAYLVPSAHSRTKVTDTEEYRGRSTEEYRGVQWTEYRGVQRTEYRGVQRTENNKKKKPREKSQNGSQAV